MPEQLDVRWREAAQCTQTDPEIFYPEIGEIPHAAKRICAQCPVRTECLTDALARGEQHGVRGGLTPNERRNLRRAQAGPHSGRRAA